MVPHQHLIVVQQPIHHVPIRFVTAEAGARVSVEPRLNFRVITTLAYHPGDQPGLVPLSDL